MAEWLNAPVLKTGELQGFGGSNPSLSANLEVQIESAALGGIFYSFEFPMFSGGIAGPYSQSAAQEAGIKHLQYGG